MGSAFVASRVAPRTVARALLFLVAVLVPGRGAATDYRWAAPASGAWSLAGNWSPAGVPASAADSAHVAFGGTPLTIDLDLNAYLRGCLLGNPQAIVRLNGFGLGAVSGLVNEGQLVATAGAISTVWGDLVNRPGAVVLVAAGGALHYNGAQWRNDGEVRVHAGGTQPAVLRAYNHSLFAGAGSLTLGDSSLAVVETPSGYGLTNGPEHTVRGAGTVTLPLVNRGLVSADVAGSWLLLTGYNKTNEGTLQATGGGRLRIEGFGLTNTNGLVHAAGGDVWLRDATVAGGTLAGDPGSEVRAQGTVSLIDARNEGLLAVPGGAALQVGGAGLTNAGLVRVRDGGSGTAILRTAGHVTFDGGGSVELTDSTGAVVETPWGYWFTNAAGHTVRGAGTFTTPLLNRGLVSADVAGSWLLLTGYNKTNEGTLQATGGGRLRIEGFGLTNTNGLVHAAGGDVWLRDATVAGGTLAGDPGSEVRAQGTVSLIDARNEGLLAVPGGAALQVGGAGLTNAGLVRVRDGGSGTAILRTAGHVTFDGGGSVELTDSTGAVVETPWGYWFTNAAGHTVRGAGTFTTPLLNRGLVSADVAGSWLLLTGYNKTNEGTLQATGGGRLRLEGFGLTNTNGLVRAAGGDVWLRDATVAGGTLTSVAGSAVTARGTVTLQDVRNTGRIDVPGAAILQLAGATLTNEGSVRLTGSGGVSDLRLAGHVTAGGPGHVELADSARAVVESPWGYWLINAAGHTIRGTGVVTMPFRNDGLLSADVAGQALRLVGPWKENPGACEARDGGILRFETIPANYDPATRRLTGGTWRAGEHSMLQLIGCPVDSIAAAVELDGEGSVLAKDRAGSDALANLARISAGGSLTIRHGRDVAANGAFSNGGELVIGPGSTFAAGEAGFAQHAGGTYRVEIAGLAPGTHGLLTVAGTAHVGGRFEAVLADDFHPALGDTFVVMRFGARVGDFDPDLPFPLGGGLFLAPEGQPDRLVLRVVGPAGVEEEDPSRPDEPAATPSRLRFAAALPGGERPLLRLECPSDVDVTIAVNSLAGRRVATLVDGPVGAGVHAWRWDGRGDGGERLASGVYLARAVVAGGGARTALGAKVVLVR